MENNTVVSNAVDAFNKEKAEQTQQQAVGLVNQIAERQERIKGCEQRIAEHRDALKKVAEDVVTEESVFGGSLPANANKTTITEVIAKANKNKQFTIEQASARLTAAIVAEQDAITGIQKQIVELQTKLLTLQAPEVTATQIAG